MKYCSNCGKGMEDTAKFCSVCGTPFDSNEKELFKCPQCGQTLNSFTAFCPSCGFELRNTKSSNSINDFFEKIQDVENSRTSYNQNRTKKKKQNNELDEADKQIISLIQSFAIPNNKEDVIEFFILASSNVSSLTSASIFVKTDRSNQIRDAWLAKCEQASIKADLLFSTNDPDYMYIKDGYQTIKRKVLINNCLYYPTFILVALTPCVILAIVTLLAVKPVIGIICLVVCTLVILTFYNFYKKVTAMPQRQSNI